MNPAFSRVRRGLLLLGGVVLAATLAHHQLADVSLLDSLYWAVITVGTVGYGERVNPEVDAAEKLLTIAVIVVGAFAVAYTGAVLVQAVVEGQIQQALGERRMIRDIAKLQDHVIICGFGRTGQHLASRLARQETPLVVVDMSEDALTDARLAEYLFIRGDATDEATLEAAGIQRARTLVASLAGDADNVFLTLTARNMRGDLAILARGDQKSTEKKLKQAGANQVIMPAVIGAQQMADIILKPHAARLIYGVGHQATQSLDADMEEVQISVESPLVGRSIRDVDARQRHEVLIVSIRRASGETVFNPASSVELKGGDTLVVIGETHQVKEFRKLYGTPGSVR